MTDAGHPPEAAPDDASAAPSAPPVVAVVVTHDAGPWLEDALESLGAQDYPNLSVLVLDAASADDPTPRIAAVAPSAFVRRLEGNAGFGASANDVLNVVEGASHFLILHDDVALEPEATRLLVEEAYRSNAGVVSPKFVSWDDPLRLLAVGASADKSGHAIVFGRGELDQEQHDAVRDVFVAPGGCQLIRADLFATIGGFDSGVTMFGEDVDLSWRAQIAGARVVVAPGARVRHLEATVNRHRPLTLSAKGEVPRDDEVAGEISRLRLRHRLRTTLVAYGPMHAARVLPQVVVFLLIESASAGGGGLRRMFDAWRWNLRSFGALRAVRKRVGSVRLVRDSDVRRLQTRSWERLTSVFRGSLAAEERVLGVGAASRDLAGAITRGGTQLTIGVWLGLLAVLILGSRHLIAGPIPLIGQIVPVPDDPWELLRLFGSGWHPSGLGSSSAPPFGFFLFGAAGSALFGAETLLQKLFVLGALPAGIIGMHRLTAPLASWRPRLVAVVLYAAVPLPYDALARGRWDALIAYAAMPWIMSRLLRSTGIAPFGAPAPEEESTRARRRRREHNSRVSSDAVEAFLGAEAGTFDQIDTEELRVAAIAVGGRHDHPRVADRPFTPPAWVRHPGSFIDQVAPLALIVALVGALAPPLLPGVLLAGLGLAVGFLVVGPFRAGLATVATAGAAVLGAGVLLIPWSIELITPGAPLGGVTGVGESPAEAPGLGELMTFQLDGLPWGTLAFGLSITALLPLLVGRSWRFAWAARLWMLAVVCWAVAYVAGRGWLGIAPPATEVLIAPAAVSVVLAAALGLAAFESDLPGYRFGWRQFASIVAAGAAMLAALPMLAASLDGRWRMPSRDFATLLSWMPEQVAAGDFRVLWLGAPDVLPLEPWRLTDDLGYGSSRNGVPDTTTLWPGPDGGATGLLADALEVARDGETTRLGALLAPMGVRYIAVPRASAPVQRAAVRAEPPVGLIDALGGQVDLRLVQTDDSIVLFENAAWEPIRAVGSQPILEPGSSVVRSSGPVVAGDATVAESYSDRWRLEVGGDSVAHTKAHGWANGFALAAPGEGTLRYRTAPLRYVLLVVELVLWVLAIRMCIIAMRRRWAAVEADREAARTAEGAA